MIRIAILENNDDLLDDLASHLQQAGCATTLLPDGTSLDAWLAEHGADVLVLRLPRRTKRPVAGKANSNIINRDDQMRWLLNSAQLELITPDGKPIPLSHDECCVLRAAVCAGRTLISRKTLIEALGQNFWHYDERRLEALISRLRRKLASHFPVNFPVRGVRGHGYLFEAELQEIGTG